MGNGLNAHGLVSVKNSTSEVLTGGSSYTGAFEDVSNFATVTCEITTTAASAAGGLDLQFSVDGTTVQSTNAGLKAVEANTTHIFARVVTARFFRLKYTNNASTSATIVITTLYHTSKSALNATRLDGNVSSTDDTLLTRPASDYASMVNTGLLNDQFTVQTFGFNPAFASGVYETVWEKGGLFVWPATAETVAIIIGGDVLDTAAGNGAREVTVEGLDQNFDRVTETIATAGASASTATTTTFTRINRAYVSKVGVYGASNEADIEIQNTTSDETLAFIVAGQGQTEQAFYTVPAGYTAYLKTIRFSSDSNKFTDIKMCVREGADDVSGDMSPFNVLQQWGSVAGEYDANFSSYIVVPEKSDIEFLAAGAGDITEVNVSFDLLVIKDT